jgi:hypothetical protein
MTHSLTGKNEINITNLKGKIHFEKQPISMKIKKIKDRVVEDYLMPLFTNQIHTLFENVYFIDKIQKNIHYFYETYKLDELIVYIELLKVIKMLIENYQIIENYETQPNSLKQSKINKNDIVSLIFKTTKIRLLPEYEIYDSILGKPKKELNQKYDDSIISTIKRLLEKDNANYTQIKEYIITNYDVTF